MTVGPYTQTKRVSDDIVPKTEFGWKRINYWDRGLFRTEFIVLIIVLTLRPTDDKI
jgi:hypothetical protein